MKRNIIACIAALAASLGSIAGAQDMSAGADASYSTSGGGTATAGASSSGGSSDIRLAVQGRVDAMNVVGDPGGLCLGGPGGGCAVTPLIPFITVGIRLLEERLFIGAGLGFAGVSADAGVVDVGRAGFGFAPTVTFDLLTSEFAALYLIGVFSIVSIGETDADPGAGGNDDITAIGLNAGAGIRGKLNESLAIGGELGWGFVSLGGAPDQFDHGLWGALVFEASIGL